MSGTAVVTGAASGLGRAIAHRFAREGIRVALWDVDIAGAQRVGGEIGEGTHAFSVDVTDTQSVRAAWAATKAALGTPSILVNSAGILGPSAGIASYPEEQWHRVLDINLNGTFRCCQAGVPDMVASGYGRIVNIASIAGKDGNPNVAAYVASKAAVIALTKSMGKELATSGVLVNAVTPAAAKTAIFDQMSEQHIGFMLSKIPMGRFLQVQEAAALIAWLASEDCSFSTGAVFDISGGRATY